MSLYSSFELHNIQEKDAETNPTSVLGRMLSQKTAVPTIAPAQAQTELGRQKYGYLNHGQCGTVFEDGSSDVIKVASHQKDEMKDAWLWNDHKQHTRISEAFKKYSSLGVDIRIPKVCYFVGRDDEKWWDAHESRFENKGGFQGRADALFTERILPVHRVFRRSLVKQFVAEDRQAEHMRAVEDAPTLVRTYLGRKQSPPGKRLALINSGNFILQLDQLEELEVDLRGFAKTMGQGLAIMHWEAHCDARDVEFVLGSPPADKGDFTPLSSDQIEVLPATCSTRELTKAPYRSIDLWLLDFNQVRTITMDAAGVDTAYRAFYLNDPYYPRPGQPLWAPFEQAYLSTSRKLMAHQEIDSGEEIGWKNLPKAFIDAMKQRAPTQNSTS